MFFCLLPFFKPAPRFDRTGFQSFLSHFSFIRQFLVSGGGGYRPTTIQKIISGSACPMWTEKVMECWRFILTRSTIKLLVSGCHEAGTLRPRCSHIHKQLPDNEIYRVSHHLVDLQALLPFKYYLGSYSNSNRQNISQLSQQIVYKILSHPAHQAK